MKRILSLALIAVMALSLAACGNRGVIAWKTKSLSPATMVLKAQDVTYTAADGTELKDNIMVSPLTHSTYKPEKTFDSLKKLAFLKDWQFELEKTEICNPHFTEHGQLNTYTYGYVINIKENVAKDEVGRWISVSYHNDTDEAIGYTSIVVSADYSDTATFTQDQVLEVLKLVYGNKNGEFLCYDKRLNEEAYKITNNDVELSFKREVDDDGAQFGIACLNNSSNATKGYAGDYTPELQQLPIIPDLLNLELGEADVRNLNMFGKSFLERHFGANAHFVVGTDVIEQMAGGYMYVQHPNDNQTSVIMAYQIAQDNVAVEDQLHTQILYTTEGDTTASYVSLELGQLMKDELTDENKAEMTEKAMAIVQDILQVEDAPDAFDEDKYFTTTVEGAEMYVIFSLDFTADDDGNEMVTLTCTITNDGNAVQSA